MVQIKSLFIVIMLLFSIQHFMNCGPSIIDQSHKTDEPKLYVQHALFQDISIDKSLVLGKFNYKIDPRFTKVDTQHATKEIYLNKQVYEAFMKMHEAAQKEGIDLKIISGTRNFNEQKVIWERKWLKYKDLEPKERAQKILEYSSMPSTSRHHWGTDLDLNSLNNSYFNSGKGFETYEWLKTYANDYGFYQVYTVKSNKRTGYNLEKWHWSYLPLASQYLSFYNSHISFNDIKGFKGDTLASTMQMISDYVNGLSDVAIYYNNK